MVGDNVATLPKKISVFPLSKNMHMLWRSSNFEPNLKDNTYMTASVRYFDTGSTRVSSCWLSAMGLLPSVRRSNVWQSFPMGLTTA